MLFVLLLLLWIIFNGRITVEVLIIGALLSLAVTLFCNKYFYKEDRSDKHYIRNTLLLVQYMGILIIEIIKANIATIGILMKKEIVINPCFCHFKTNLKNPLHRILLANSITLTPGTITVDLDEKGNYTVHCLTKEFADGINESIFVKMLTKMEEK